MGKALSSPILQLIHRAVKDERVRQLSDQSLIQQFCEQRDEAAFATLLYRHGPMVLGVCRSVLPNETDAEDVFQATFLILARKAGFIRKAASVGSWLHGVAHRTALKARAQSARREKNEVRAPARPVSEPDDLAWREVQQVLHEELTALAERYRAPLVACYLEGKTQEEAAAQLGVAVSTLKERMERGRSTLRARLVRRGLGPAAILAGAAWPAAATAFVPGTLASSTIQAAQLFAGGQAATTVASAHVAALIEGMVKTMFMTKIKSVLAVALVVAALAGAAGLIYQTQAADEPKAKLPNAIAGEHSGKAEPRQDRGQARARAKPDETDEERMVGNWYVMNDNSMHHKGEFWVITKDSILMNAKAGGAIAHQHLHRLDAGKTPKQIDITVTKVNGPPIGVIKGIYALDGDELRLWLADMGKDRPASFPEKPGSGEVLILHREKAAAQQPPALAKQQPVKTDEERMVGAWIIKSNDGIRKRKGEAWSIGKHQIVMNANLTGFPTMTRFHRLDATKNPKQIDITVTVVAGVFGPDVPIKADARVIGVIKGIYAFDDDDTELRLCLGEMGKDRPTEFAGTPGQSEFLVLYGGDPAAWHRKAAKEEKLRALIDQVLDAHGGEDKLNKLTSFTMTVKHSNAETQHYFVQPPRNFRWETTHRDRTGKRIVILFPEGRRWWTKEPNEEAVEFRPTGAERTMEYHLDYVKFFGPRQVLRLKDADHRATLLDEEAKIGDRTAVGVKVIGPEFNRKMYFDKETHLLLKSGAITYSDYKKFDGIPVAQKEDDGYLMPQVTDFRVVEKFDPKIFEQP